MNVPIAADGKSTGSSGSAELAGHVALVTGGTSGIGLAAARAFLSAGAAVMICGRSPERGEQAVHDLTPHGEVTFTQADVTDDRSVRHLVERTLHTFGRLDHAFNNAANTEAAGTSDAFTDMTLDEFEGIVRASLTSVWLCMKHQLPALTEHGGTIVNTSPRTLNCDCPEPAATRQPRPASRSSPSPSRRSTPSTGCESTPYAREPSRPRCWNATSARPP